VQLVQDDSSYFIIYQVLENNMGKKKKVGIGAAALLTIIAGIAGGDYAFDFSETNTWNQNQSTVINEGDVNLESGITCEKLKQLCKDQSNSIDPKIRKYCPMLDIMC